MEALKQIIEESFGLRPEHFPPEVQNSVDEVIKLLQQGKLRVAEKIDGNWVHARMDQKSRSFELPALSEAKWSAPATCPSLTRCPPASIIFPKPIGKNPASAVCPLLWLATAATSLRRCIVPPLSTSAPTSEKTPWSIPVNGRFLRSSR